MKAILQASADLQRGMHELLARRPAVTDALPEESIAWVESGQAAIAAAQKLIALCQRSRWKFTEAEALKCLAIVDQAHGAIDAITAIAAELADALEALRGSAI